MRSWRLGSSSPRLLSSAVVGLSVLLALVLPWGGDAVSGAVGLRAEGLRAPQLRSRHSQPIRSLLRIRGGNGEAPSAVTSALDSLRNRAQDSGTSGESFLQALNLISLMIGNVAKNPDEKKFRKVRAGNKAFSSKIAPVDGAAEVLVACGFKATKESPGEGKPEELFYVAADDVKKEELEKSIVAINAAIKFEKNAAADTLGTMVTTKPAEAAAIEEVWKLRCQIKGHSGDVRGVAITDDGNIVTASRDKTVKIWKAEKDNRQFEESASLEGHEYHVASCANVPKQGKFEELQLSGSYDLTSAGEVKTPALVNVWEKGSLKKSLEGHKATVSCLASTPEGDQLVSGSWDKTIKIWDRKTLECVNTLEGHSQAIWALLPLGGGKLLSGSADRKIMLWDGNKCIGTLDGHGDCVRALAAMPDGKFISASNDCTLKIWSIELGGNSLDQSCGYCLGTMTGHENFIYSVAVLPNGDIISGGEDRSVRIWHEGKCVCVLRHPDTIWSVAALPNGDIVTACADGITRVYTQAEERMADDEELKEFEAMLANCTLQSHTMGGLQLDKLPGPEALEQPGTTAGQTRVVRQGSQAFAYSWNQAEKKWDPVGEVVDSAGEQMGGGKRSLDGVEYDYIFDIEIEEGRVEKIGINKGGNPYMTASDFIDKHELSADYLDTIAKWISEELNKINPPAEDNLPDLSSDPFNEGKVYRAGSAGSMQNMAAKAKPEAQVYYDPFTGKKLGAAPGDESDDDDDRPKAPSKPAVHIPSAALHSFPTPLKAEPVLKKVGELNAGYEGAQKMSDEELARFKKIVEGLGSTDLELEAEDEVLINKLLGWPKDGVFPVLDVVRVLMTKPKIAGKWATKAMGAYSMAYAQEGGVTAEAMQKAQGNDIVLKVIMTANSAEGEAKPPMPTVLMAQRTVCNAFLHKEMKALLQLHVGTVATVFADTGHTDKKTIQMSHSSLLLNYAVLLSGMPIDDKVMTILIATSAKIVRTFNGESETQAMYRLCCAMGTFLYQNPGRIALASQAKIENMVRDRILGLDSVRGGLGSVGDPKTQQACYQLLEVFDMVRLMQPGLKHPETADEFNSILKVAGNKPVIVDFYADWCGPCKMIAPVFEKMAEENPQAVFVKVNVDELGAVSQKYGVTAMPTFKVLKQGKEVESIQGANEGALRQAIQKHSPAPAPSAS